MWNQFLIQTINFNKELTLFSGRSTRSAWTWNASTDKLDHRIAKHFKSPRVRTAEDADSLYELLRNAKMFATDSVSLEVRLSQDDVLYKAPRGSMVMDLREDGSNLTVYLPRGKIPQQHTFHKQLPERLIQWLMTEQDSCACGEISYKAITVMKDVWNAPVATLSATLDEWGIIPVSTPSIDPVIQYSASESDSGVNSETPNGEWSGSRGVMQSGETKPVDASKVADSSQPAPDIPDTCTAGTNHDEDFSKSIASPTRRGAPLTVPVMSAAPKWDFSKWDETHWF